MTGAGTTARAWIWARAGPPREEWEKAVGVELEMGHRLGHWCYSGSGIEESAC